MEDPAPELWRAIADDLAAERGAVAWLRSRGRPFRLALVLAVVAVELGFYAWILLRPDIAVYPVVRMVVATGAYAIVLGAAAWYALRPLYLPAPRRTLRAVLAVGLLTPFALALLPAVPTSPAALAEYAPLASAYFCLADGSLLALPVLLVVRAIDRQGLRAPAAATLCAGLVGVLGLQLQCPVNLPAHLMLGHATLPLVLLLGIFVIRRT
jgi:hypothetical protein